MPPKKAPKKNGKASAPRGMGKPISPGLQLTDLVKKPWMLGPVIGQGGFGYIYLGDSGSGGNVTEANANYVIKVEPHANGPLFVELAFYQRVAKADKVKSWMSSRKKNHLGVPVYIATGSFEHNSTRYRFMVMDRFGTDVEKIYKQANHVFPEKTVYSLGLRVVDALEYIHENEYVHADIKSSNLMMGFKKADVLKVYLLDYGLSFRYMTSSHVPYKEDPKRKHDGTIEYTSIDAHKGCAPSRRGDMEILGYCMVQWLCKKLPWEDNLENKEYVSQQKQKCMENVDVFMKKCFNEDNIPDKLQEYMELVHKMEYAEKPDYDKIRKLFQDGLKQVGYSDDGKSVYLPTGRTPRKRLSIASGNEASPQKVPSKKDTSKARKPLESDPDDKRKAKSDAKTTPSKRSRARKVIEADPDGSTKGKATSTAETSPSKRVTTPRKRLEVYHNDSPAKKKLQSPARPSPLKKGKSKVNKPSETNLEDVGTKRKDEISVEASPPKRVKRNAKKVEYQELSDDSFEEPKPVRKATPVKSTTPMKIKATPVKNTTPMKRNATPVKSTTPMKRNATPVKNTTPMKRNATPVKNTTPMERNATPVKNTTPMKNKALKESNMCMQAGKVVLQDISKVINVRNLEDKVVEIDGVMKTIHRRVRRKNVPTRDFAQSP